MQTTWKITVATANESKRPCIYNPKSLWYRNDCRCCFLPPSQYRPRCAWACMTAPCTPSYIDSCSFCLLTVSNKPVRQFVVSFDVNVVLLLEPHSSPYVLFNSWTQRDRLISMIHFHINSIHLCCVIEILMLTCNTQTPNGILTIPNKLNQLYSNDTVLMAFLRGNVYWIFNEF